MLKSKRPRLDKTVLKKNKIIGLVSPDHKAFIINAVWY